MKPWEEHEGMPAGWNKFRYDILLPKHKDILGRVEDHTIRAFAYVLKSKAGISSLGPERYTLVNRACKKP